MKNHPEYLDKLNRKLNDEQMNVCLSDNNTVVAAGAGSGKTHTLATRFAYLVITKNIPANKILTLTFTKKASAEMYHRIYLTLDFFANTLCDGISEEEKQRANQALKDFSTVHIQTLDSYCANVVRQAANIYGIRPDFSTGAEKSNSASTLALQFVLKNKNNVAIKKFAANGQLQKFAENVIAYAVENYTSLATEENYFTNNFEKQKKAIESSWNNSIVIYNDYVKDFFIIPTITSKQNLDTSYNDFFAIAQNIDSILELLFKNKILKKTNDKETIELIKSICSFVENYNELAAFYKLLDEFTAIVNTNKRVTGSLSFNDIVQMTLKILKEQSDIRNQERAAFDKIMIDEFQDNNGDNRDLLFLLASKDNDGKVINNVVDEVELEDDKLFFVGDEKQSIYKFRGADVAVFNELKTMFESSDGFKEMTTNYRSDNVLVSLFNKLFGDGKSPIFKETLSSDENYEAQYQNNAIGTNLETHETLPEVDIADIKENNNYKIHFYDICPSKLIDDSETENFLDTHLTPKETRAYYIAKQIKTIYEDAKQKNKSIKYKDFAILERTRDRKELIDALNKFNIPYTLDVNSNIFSDAIVNDIYNYLRLCIYPSDNKSFMAFLCSPFANLSINAAQKILASIMSDSKFKDCDDEKIKTALKENSGEYEKYLNAKNFFNKSKHSALSAPLTETITKLWYDCAYYYETLTNKTANMHSEEYDCLFELARTADSNSKSLGWFIDNLALMQTTFGNDNGEIDLKSISYPIEKSDSVQIMTIHNSKGLEFDYVFVNGCYGMKLKPDTSSFTFTTEYGLSYKTGSTSDFFRLLYKSLFDKMSVAEFRRLIYVAVTRARQEVFIYGAQQSGSTESHRIFEKILEDYFGNAPDDSSYFDGKKVSPLENENPPFELIRVKPITHREVLKTIGGKSKQTPIEEMKINLIAKAKNFYDNKNNFEEKDLDSIEINSFKTSPNALEKKSAKNFADKDNSDESKTSLEEDTLVSAKFTAADFGNIAHEILEQCANGISLSDAYPNIKHFKNLSQKEIDINLSLAKEYASNFLNSSLGKQMIEAKKKNRFVEAEYKFRLCIGDYLLTGSIDLIFENDDGTFTIVDYKTDQSIDAEKYFAQQNCYRIALSQIITGGDTSKIKTYLYFLRKNETEATIDITNETATPLTSDEIKFILQTNK